MLPNEVADCGDDGRRMSNAGGCLPILKGAKPGDLPIDVIKQHVLIINLKTAREIGVTIPSELLRRADQVIE